MNKQSEAVGAVPVLSGWPQSPCAARATDGGATPIITPRANTAANQHV
jgi:hypothetical protein